MGLYEKNGRLLHLYEKEVLDYFNDPTYISEEPYEKSIL